MFGRDRRRVAVVVAAVLQGCGGDVQNSSNNEHVTGGGIGGVGASTGETGGVGASSGGAGGVAASTGGIRAGTGGVVSGGAGSSETGGAADSGSGGSSCGAVPLLFGTCGYYISYDPRFSCCGSASCYFLGNDPQNCGSCGHQCPPSASFCDNGTCTQPVCSPPCSNGKICCHVHSGGAEGGRPNDGGPGFGDVCVSPENGTCPIGCPTCVCAAYDTKIATAEGERAITTLHPGDLVWSIDHGEKRLVPILRTNRSPVLHHHMVAVELEGGRVIRMSERHPTALGRPFVELSPGDLLGESKVAGIRSVPYEGDATYDILPDSDTGVYFVEGAPVGSTLKAGFPGAPVPQ